MRLRLLRHGWFQTGLWLILAAISLHLANQLGLRWDLTRDGRFGLSDGALAVVADLQRPVVARVYFTEGLEAPYHGHRAALLDLLDELSAASGGRIEVTVHDPTGDPALQEEAASLGIRPIPYAYRSRERTEARTVYLGVALASGDQRTAIEALPSIPRMEGELARAIHTLTAAPDDRKTVGWWLGHGEPDPTTAPAGSPLRTLQATLGARGGFRTVAEGDAPIPDDIDVLLVAAPRDPVPAAEIVHLDQFVMRGGRVLVFLSSFQADFERGTPVPVDHGLYAWLGQLGVRPNRDLLLDRDHNEVLAIPVGGRWVRVNHPLAVVSTALDRTIAPVRPLQRLVLPFASSLTVADPLPDGVEAEVWATTDGDAGAVKGLVTLDPSVLANRLSSEVAGPHPVVVALSGTFRSWFGERPVPPRTDPEAAPFADLLTTSPPTRLVVVSSADAVANDLELVSNAVDWLVEDPVLIGIRSRIEGDPELPVPSRAVANRTRLVLVGAPLLVLAAIGAVAARRGRR